MAIEESLAQADARSAYIAGIRALADLLEQHDDLPLPDEPGHKIAWNVWPHAVNDVPAEMARIRRLLPGTFTKNDPKEHAFDAKYYRLTAPLHGLTLEICSFREAVCERVVTGRREVEKQVPVAFETQTVVEEDVEWVCKPLLADAEQVPA